MRLKREQVSQANCESLLEAITVISTFFRDSLKTTPNISFIVDGSNIFTQVFATQLPYVTFRFTWQAVQTLPGPCRRLAPVIKCRRFLSFFQHYTVSSLRTQTYFRLSLVPLTAGNMFAFAGYTVRDISLT